MARADNYHSIKGCLPFLYAIKTVNEKGIYNYYFNTLTTPPYVIDNQLVT